MRDIAASSMHNAPAAPCYVTVWPVEATLAAGLYVAAAYPAEAASYAASFTSAARPKLRPISTNLACMAATLSAFKPDN